MCPSNPGLPSSTTASSAKALASLNHPNIAAVYGFHEAQGVQFLVLPLDEALDAARQIAAALDAAHEQDIEAVGPRGLWRVDDHDLRGHVAPGVADSPTTHSATAGRVG